MIYPYLDIKLRVCFVSFKLYITVRNKFPLLEKDLEN
jgi:hypothetical protein